MDKRPASALKFAGAPGRHAWLPKEVDQEDPFPWPIGHEEKKKANWWRTDPPCMDNQGGAIS